MAAIVDLQTQIAAIASATLGIPMGLSEAGFDHAQPTGLRLTEAELQQEFNPLISIDDSSDEEQASAELQDENLCSYMSIAQLETEMYQQDYGLEEHLDLNTPEGPDVQANLRLGGAEPADEVHAPEVGNPDMSVEAQTPSQREIVAAAEGRLDSDSREAGDNPVSMEVTNAEVDNMSREEVIPADDFDISAHLQIQGESSSIGLDEAVADENSLARSDRLAFTSPALHNEAEFAMGQQVDERVDLAEVVVQQQADEAITFTEVALGQQVDKSFVVGQLVEMRDGDREWRQGYVISESPLMVGYKMDGHDARGYTFDEVRATGEGNNNRSLVTSATAFSLELPGLQEEASNRLSVYETVLPICDDSNHDATRGPEAKSRSWLSCALCSRRSQQASKRKVENHADEPVRKLQKR